MRGAVLYGPRLEGSTYGSRMPLHPKLKELIARKQSAPAPQWDLPIEEVRSSFRALWTGGADPRDPRASPLWASELANLPPTLIVAAEFDTLRDEAEAYASKLRAARVSEAYTCWPGMIHGFLQMAGLVDDARHAIHEIATFLRTHTARA